MLPLPALSGSTLLACLFRVAVIAAEAKRTCICLESVDSVVSSKDSVSFGHFND